MLYLVRNLRIVRALFVIIVYIIMPLDLLPEKFLGVIGLIDDLFFILFVLVFIMTIAAIQYHRSHH
jgi:uncharacterized membrane protein YkvA (DUF1232 family)